VVFSILIIFSNAWCSGKNVLVALIVAYERLFVDRGKSWLPGETSDSKSYLRTHEPKVWRKEMEFSLLYHTQAEIEGLFADLE
jgi:hypothetical protein